MFNTINSTTVGKLRKLSQAAVLSTVLFVVEEREVLKSNEATERLTHSLSTRRSAFLEPFYCATESTQLQQPLSFSVANKGVRGKGHLTFIVA